MAPTKSLIIANGLMFGGLAFCLENPIDYESVKKQVEIGDTKVLALQIGANKESLLHMAAQKGDTQLLAQLIKLGGVVSVQNKFGATPLHFAATPEIVAILLHNKADIAAVDQAGQQPIHSASGRGLTPVLKALIATGADVNAKDEAGWTPLHWAKDIDTMKTLLAAGADKSIRTLAGESPLDTHSQSDPSFQSYMKEVGFSGK